MNSSAMLVFGTGGNRLDIVLEFIVTETESKIKSNIWSIVTIDAAHARLWSEDEKERCVRRIFVNLLCSFLDSPFFVT